tara:strand:- start:1126 stop:1401 length:276 start_codon:yes stop_codon:yes gene_type:complete
MIVVEIYSFENNERVHKIREFKDQTAWDMERMLMRIANTWVGHKLYHNLTMREWAQATPEERMILVPEQEFDKEAFLAHKTKGKAWGQENP